jgi:hypothetical protein
MSDPVLDGLMTAYSMLTLLYHRGHITYTTGTFASPTQQQVMDAIVLVERGIKAQQAGPLLRPIVEWVAEIDFRSGEHDAMRDRARALLGRSDSEEAQHDG